MTTCERSPENLSTNGRKVEQSTFSLADFRVNRSARPASNSRKKTSDTFGRKCSESFARSSRAGLLARMLTASFVWRSTLYALTWKVKATPSKRSYCQLAASPFRTADTEHGSSRVYPTPIAIYGEHPGMTDTSHLTGAAMQQERAWPTPTAGDVSGSRTLPPGTTATGKRPDGKKAQVGLPNAVRLAESATGTLRLSAAWTLRLMGFPDGYLNLGPVGIPINAGETAILYELSITRNGKAA